METIGLLRWLCDLGPMAVFDAFETLRDGNWHIVSNCSYKPRNMAHKDSVFTKWNFRSCAQNVGYCCLLRLKWICKCWISSQYKENHMQKNLVLNWEKYFHFLLISSNTALVSNTSQAARWAMLWIPGLLRFISHAEHLSVKAQGALRDKGL